jgi:hypothetical protein
MLPEGVRPGIAIRKTFDEVCLQQALNSHEAPGVAELVLTRHDEGIRRLRGSRSPAGW